MQLHELVFKAKARRSPIPATSLSADILRNEPVADNADALLGQAAHAARYRVERRLKVGLLSAPGAGRNPHRV
jgi:hypothetical protein